MDNNSGIISKIALTFLQPLNLADKIRLTCFFSIFFHVSPTSVYTDDQVTCDEYSK